MRRRTTPLADLTIQRNDHHVHTSSVIYRGRTPHKRRHSAQALTGVCIYLCWWRRSRHHHNWQHRWWLGSLNHSSYFYGVLFTRIGIPLRGRCTDVSLGAAICNGLDYHIKHLMCFSATVIEGHNLNLQTNLKRLALNTISFQRQRKYIIRSSAVIIDCDI